ncbi:MAG: DNA cytosine methyltransferase [Scytonema sp. RU_4_4]|nr:DNA cytosine methyltransferase [Scytonema sp. RU_4_4]
MLKAATLFSGGGVLDAAIMKYADKGLSVRLAVEGDPSNPELSHAIADVYAANYPDTQLLRQSVETVNFRNYYDNWFLLHASPSCKSFSNANTSNGGEKEKDLTAAIAVARAIREMQPHYFTLEQVRGYVKSASFALIYETLVELGYAICFDVINASSYSVPQDRERMCLIAHRGNSLVGMPVRQRPVSWMDALAHRIDYMNFAEPTVTQKQALYEHRLLYPDTEAFLVQRLSIRDNVIIRHPYELAPTITCAIFTDNKAANRKSFLNIWYKGQWLDLSVRDCAILQSIPDWYYLPPQSRIAGAVVGNGVPTKLYEAILGQIFKHYEQSYR